MAGQGIERRQVLKILGTAAAAAQVPGFSRWAFACGHAGNAAAQIRPATYQPVFFTTGEYASVERLCDLIIPADETPGAKEAGVAEFIDFMVANDPEAQYPFRTGLTWLDAESDRMAGKHFIELLPDQQMQLLEPLAYKEKARPGSEEGQAFFHLVRDFVVTGYYTSEIGYRQLDNPALKLYSESPACPHMDDPEHTRLSPSAI